MVRVRAGQGELGWDQDYLLWLRVAVSLMIVVYFKWVRARFRVRR